MTGTATVARLEAMENYWAPFTSNRDFRAEPKIFVRAEGMYYWSDRGDRILDASSGLFCSAAGHGRPEIADAVAQQLRELDFTPSFLRAHPKAFELAARIADVTPGALDKVFFTNSGSEAVDTAMKIALAYWRAKGQGQKTMFVARERAYHGVNMGGTSLQGIVRNRAAFGPGLPGIVHLRHTWIPENRFERGEGTHGVELAEDLARFVALHGAENIAACFVEPIAGSTGVLVPPKGYLRRLRELCDQHGILLVFDEVITGVGRTGDWFAARSFEVTPDMITMAKILTNGAVPMGAVAIRRDIHDTIIDAAPEGAIELFHGYTYSAHPVACAAGLAALEIYRRDALIDRAKSLSPYFLDMLWSLRDAPGVIDIRGYGLMGAVEIAPDGVPGARGHRLQKKLFDAGLHLKTTGDSAILAPAFVAEKSHIDQMGETMRTVLRTI